jgi:serine/threonine-protein kinase
LSILVFVHSHGVIHRDIKPDNLIRRQHDSKLVLVDFGSVKQAWTQVITTGGQTSATFANSLSATIAIGTPGYMPTEQGRGRPQPNSDIYALGMIAIQALTGINPTQLIEESDNGEIAWQNRADVNEALASILTKMVRYNFKNRYQTATEVLKALQQLIDSQLPQLELVAGIRSGQQTCPLLTTSLPWQRSQEYRLSSQNSIVFTLPTASASNANSQAKFVAASQPSSEGVLTATTASITQPTVFAPLEPQVSSSSKDSSKNIIPNAAVNSSAIQKKRQESHTAIPFFQNQNRLQIGAAITAILIGVVAVYTTEWSLASKQRTQESIATLTAAGKYQECANQATAKLSESHSKTNAQTLLYECRLAQAKQLAAAENFPAAIAQASKIPQTDASYAAAQQLIARWSHSLLAIAKEQYNWGKLNQAIAEAKAIPKTSPVYQQAQGTIKQWQKDWKNNNSSWQAAKSALAAGKWQNALFAAKKVNTPYWQNKIQPIIQQAEAKIAASRTVVSSQPKRAVTKRPIRTPARTATRAVTKRPIRTPARTATRAVTKRPIRTPARTATRAVTKRPIRIARPRLRLTRRKARTTLKRLPTSVTRIRVRTTPRRLPSSITKRSTRIIYKRATRSAKTSQWYRGVTKTVVPNK